MVYRLIILGLWVTYKMSSLQLLQERKQAATKCLEYHHTHGGQGRGGEPAAGLHFVGTKEDLIKAKRSFRTLEGRDILVLYHQEIFYALDFHCYHAGGPLQNGDIEEFDGKLCIVCPKHKYKISLAEGEGIYRATNPYAPVPTKRWYSKGIKQRVHTVTETDGDVYVTLSHMSRFIESDYFQGEKGKVERERMEAEDSSKKSNTTS